MIIQAFPQKAGFPNTAYICLAKIQMLGKWIFATFSIVQSERFPTITFKVDVVKQTVFRALIGPIRPELSSNWMKFASTYSITNVFKFDFLWFHNHFYIPKGSVQNSAVVRVAPELIVYHTYLIHGRTKFSNFSLFSATISHVCTS